MIDISAKVEWLVGSDQALAELGKKSTEKNVLVRTLTKAAEPFRDAWKEAAPKLTGHYAESIHIGQKLTRRQRASAYRNGVMGVAEIHIGTTDPAGLFTEFGTYKMTAEPSGRPTWDALQGQVLAKIGTGLWEEIDKARARAARKQAKAAA